VLEFIIMKKMTKTPEEMPGKFNHSGI
jgi:hypothetical protein